MTKNKKVCTRCIQATGGCCVGIELCIHIDELNPFKVKFESQQIPKDHTLEVHNEDGDVYIYSPKEDDPCMFLELEYNRCSIYEKRPLICKLYPLMWQEKNGEMNYYIDFACPLSHLIPVQELYKWANKPNDRKLIEKMGELVFNSSKNQYVNLTVIHNKVEPSDLLKEDSINL